MMVLMMIYDEVKSTIIGEHLSLICTQRAILMIDTCVRVNI